ncbi:MAG: TIM-barrel domain-containing protein [Chloroflexota bacterium]
MIEIIHTPKGQEHPYEQLPEERFPREPLAGKPFKIGIVTRPPGQVESVSVHTRLDGIAGPAIAAHQIPDWKPRLEVGVGLEALERMVIVDQDVWEAQLTAPEYGHTLTYWIEADGHPSPPYTLRGEAWQPDPYALSLDETQPGQWAMRIRRGRGTRAAQPGLLPSIHAVEWLTDGACARRVRIALASAPDEAFFGLGERYNVLNQRGEILDVRCYEQYKNQGKRTYLPIPFVLSSAGYGLYVKSNRWMRFDLAATQPDRWVLEADLGPDEALDLAWFTGASPLEITGEFAQCTGPVALPPLWAFGLWMSGNEWNSQARVQHEVEQSLAHGIIPSVLVIEAWSDETTFYIWNEAQYVPVPGERALRRADFTFPAEGKWPDPQGMIDDLHRKNIRILLWQIPVLRAFEGRHPQHEADRAYFEQRGFGVREADGSLYKVRPSWFRNGYLWDVTNPAARAWWLEKRAYLLEEMGIDGFKTDGGEHLWGSDTQFADERQGDELWNVYPQLYSETYYRFACEKRGGDALTFSRAGFVGSQRSPAHWAGDEGSNWDAFRHSILAGLSAGISGIPFWGWDIAGFSGEVPSAELYLRAAAMAAFCPIMQYHSEFNHHREPCRDRTPWNIQARTSDERVIPTFRFFVNVRHNLMPYIWQEAQHAAQTGQPMMRALALWEHEAPPYQYFFGRDLLVCPVVEAGVTTRPVYLPEGEWIDLWTRERFAGKQIVQMPAPLDRIPVLVRAGAALPVCWGPGKRFGDYVPLSASATDIVSYG